MIGRNFPRRPVIGLNFPRDWLKFATGDFDRSEFSIETYDCLKFPTVPVIGRHFTERPVEKFGIFPSPKASGNMKKYKGKWEEKRKYYEEMMKEL